MTRKHYIALAAALAATRPEDGPAYDAWCAVVVAICDVLAADNPRFDRGRFQYAATAS
jgi:phytoene dehydrogenase-like protein